MRALVLLAVTLLCAGPVLADASRRPPPLAKVAVERQPGRQLPLELPLEDSRGHGVRLGDYFKSGRPVLLTLAYIECTMLCNLVVRGVANAVREMTLAPGIDYRLVTVAIDPRETRAAAADKERSLRRSIDREAADDASWVYLRGTERDVRRLARAVGFGYAWDERTEQYAHPAVAVVVRDDGRIAKYFEGVRFPPAALELALRDETEPSSASASVAESVLSCFRFDPALREHRERIQRFFRAGALGVLLVLAGSIAGLALWHRRRR